MSRKRPLRFSDLFARPLPGIREPISPSFTSDGRYLLYLLPDFAGRLSLHRMEIASGEDAVIMGSDAGGGMSASEELRRERMRIAFAGVSFYALLGLDRIVANGGGGFAVIDLDGRLDSSYNLEGARECTAIGELRAVAMTTGEEIWLVSPGERHLIASAPGRSLGVAEYVAQEELGRMSGLWATPGGELVVAAEVDESMVSEHVIVRTDVHPNVVERYRYPFVGEANAEVSLRVLSAVGREAGPFLLPVAGGYLASLHFLDRERAVVGVLDRAQKRLERHLLGAEGWLGLWHIEEGEPWVNLPEGEFAYRGGLVTTSEANSSIRQVVFIDPRGLERSYEGPLVTALAGVEGDRAFAIGHGGNPLTRSLFAVNLEGGEWEELARGCWSSAVAPGGGAFTESRSAISEPQSLVVRSGSELQVVSRSDPEIELRPPELVRARLGDGSEGYGAVYLPADGVSEGRPAVISVYGGPHVQTVTDSWTLTYDLFAQYLAQQGAVVMKLDGRGSFGRGRGFEAPLAGRMGTVELEDQIAAVAYLVEERGVDASRIGIYGWSYGGYMTLMALTKAAGVFRVGVSGAPVVDHRWYDTAYAERYMGVDPGVGYEEASVLPYLDRLAGSLMVIHGAIDENVHFGHTAALLARAAELGKEIELVFLPSSRHSPRGEANLRLIAEKRARFLLGNLGLDAGI